MEAHVKEKKEKRPNWFIRCFLPESRMGQLFLVG